MPMSKELRLQWAAALRSGKYIQGRNSLCSISTTGSRAYCCLGVLASLLDAFEPKPCGDRLGLKSSSSYPFSNCHTLPDGLLDELGLSRYAQSALISANDTLEWTFDQIASVIEKGAIDGVEI